VGGGPEPEDAAEESARAAAARRRAREALFGDSPTVSADERDDADRARGDDGGRDRRWYDDQRPPHHG
jgi:hypothetical protein